jgi:hypothetical protein
MINPKAIPTSGITGKDRKTKDQQKTHLMAVSPKRNELCLNNFEEKQAGR